MKRTLAGVLLVCAPAAALAATRVEDLVVKPNPAERQVEIAVTVNRDQFDGVVYIKLVLSCFPQGGWQTTPPWPPRVRGWRAPCQGSGGGGTWCGAAFDQAREGRRPGRDARLSRPAGFRALDESVHRNGDGTGPFSFGISCTTCGNGALGITSNVVFSIANATIADITAGNPLNIFVADVFSGQTGNTGRST